MAEFQDLKYNDVEKYARHIQSTVEKGKSCFFDDVDVEALYDKYKTTGRLRKNRDGSRTFKENINLPVGQHLGIDIYTGKEINGMTIHYSKTGVHIVPLYYKEK